MTQDEFDAKVREARTAIVTFLSLMPDDATVGEVRNAMEQAPDPTKAEFETVYQRLNFGPHLH